MKAENEKLGSGGVVYLICLRMKAARVLSDFPKTILKNYVERKKVGIEI